MTTLAETPSGTRPRQPQVASVPLARFEARLAARQWHLLVLVPITVALFAFRASQHLPHWGRDGSLIPLFLVPIAVAVCVVGHRAGARTPRQQGPTPDLVSGTRPDVLSTSQTLAMAFVGAAAAAMAAAGMMACLAAFGAAGQPAVGEALVGVALVGLVGATGTAVGAAFPSRVSLLAALAAVPLWQLAVSEVAVGRTDWFAPVVVASSVATPVPSTRPVLAHAAWLAALTVAVVLTTRSRRAAAVAGLAAIASGLIQLPAVPDVDDAVARIGTAAEDCDPHDWGELCLLPHYDGWAGAVAGLPSAMARSAPGATVPVRVRQYDTDQLTDVVSALSGQDAETASRRAAEANRSLHPVFGGPLATNDDVPIGTRWSRSAEAETAFAVRVAAVMTGVGGELAIRPAAESQSMGDGPVVSDPMEPVPCVVPDDIGAVTLWLAAQASRTARAEILRTANAPTDHVFTAGPGVLDPAPHVWTPAALRGAEELIRGAPGDVEAAWTSAVAQRAHQPCPTGGSR
jgi:hypothetical protein